jgi:hypothetical protein
MADISIVKIKIRRGNDSDRLKIILDEGELGFTTDTKRFFVGDGNTYGGISITTNFLGFGSLSAGTFSEALPYDLAFDTTTDRLFALSGGNGGDPAQWYDVSPRVDNKTIYYNINKKLEVVPNSIDYTKINVPSIAGIGLYATALSGGAIAFQNDNYTIKVDANNTVFTDPSVFQIMDLKRVSNSLDCTGLRMENLPYFNGLSQAQPGVPAYDNLPVKTVYIMREPVDIGPTYLMIKFA